MRPVAMTEIPRSGGGGGGPATFGLRSCSGGTLQPDAMGKSTLAFRPSGLMILNMCPFPCMAAGCCMSRCSDLVIDDRQQTLAYASNPAYCVCLRNYKDVPFDEVANVAVVLDVCCGCCGWRVPCRMDKYTQMAHSMVILLKDGTMLPLGDMKVSHEAEKEELHWYFFGRNDSQYRQPSSFLFDPKAPSRPSLQKGMLEEEF